MAFVAVVPAIGSAVLPALGTIGSGLGGALASGAGAIGSGLGAVGSALGSVPLIGGLAKPALTGLGGAIGGLGSGLGGGLSALSAGNLGGALSSVGSGVLGGGANLLSGLGGMYGGADKLLGGMLPNMGIAGTVTPGGLAGGLVGGQMMGGGPVAGTAPSAGGFDPFTAQEILDHNNAKSFGLHDGPTMNPFDAYSLMPGGAGGGGAGGGVGAGFSVRDLLGAGADVAGAVRPVMEAVDGISTNPAQSPEGQQHQVNINTAERAQQLSNAAPSRTNPYGADARASLGRM